MKKLFTLVALLACVLGAKGEWVEDYKIDYSTYRAFPFYVMGYVPEWFDGVMTDFGANYKYVAVEYAEETSDVTVKTEQGGEYYKIETAKPTWHQYFIADGIPTELEGAYTVKALVKASEATTINVNMGWGWADGQQASASVAIPTDWTEVEWEYSGIGGTSCNLVAQPGTATATIEWKWVTVSHNQKESKSLNDYIVMSSTQKSQDGNSVIITPAINNIKKVYVNLNESTTNGSYCFLNIYNEKETLSIDISSRGLQSTSSHNFSIKNNTYGNIKKHADNKTYSWLYYNTDNKNEIVIDVEEYLGGVGHIRDWQKNFGTSCVVNIVTEDSGNPKIADPIDLGLSVKWASWNIGASFPEDYGWYFSWGEISPKSNYAWSKYRFGSSPTKYNSTDNIKTLESSDDAAVVLWGGKWRMPTNDEEKELYEKCKWSYTKRNGINGYRVTGPNGNSIFLPAAGLYDESSTLYNYSDKSGGWYWSSTSRDNLNANGLYFTSSSVSYSISTHDKCDGHVIRPVYVDNNKSIVLTAKSYSREYGDTNPSFEYTVSGGSINGTPKITCSATKTSPVGTYPIMISKGSVTNSNVEYIDGTLTITKASLTVTANSYTRAEGEDNPSFDVTYSGFKNGETETVLTRNPTVTTSATTSSGPGTYDINVSGAEAQNYTFNYVKGTLTITETMVVGKVFESGGIYYKIGKIGDVVYVTDGDSEYQGDVVIPSHVTYNDKTYSVTNISSDSFSGCHDLTSVIIPTGVVSIGEEAFYLCSSLASVIIPNSLTSIGSGAFHGCKSLTSIVIPNSVTSIRGSAFSGCSSLVTVISEIENPFEIKSDVFSGIPSDAELIVPKGTKALYQATEGWNMFKKITESGGDGTVDNDIDNSNENLEDDFYTIGAKDYSSGWWTQFSKYYQIPEGQKWVAQFNLSINPYNIYTYKNFALIITSDADRGTDGYHEYGGILFSYQPSGYSEWGEYIDRSLVSSTLVFDSDTDNDVYQLGGIVSLTIDRTNGGLEVTMTNGKVTKTYNQTTPLVNLNEDKSNTNIRAFLLPEGSYMEFLGSNIEPIGGKGDKMPLSMTLNGVPLKVYRGTEFAKAFANVTATIQFEQGVSMDVNAKDLTFQTVPDMYSLGTKTVVAVYSKSYYGEDANPVKATVQFEVVDNTYTNIGNADNSTPWWGDHSENIKVAPGETYVCRFTNYTNGQNNWNNFVVVLCKANNTEYAVVRADNYGWGAGYDDNPNLQTSGGQSDWGAWLAAMDGAKVTCYVTNNGDGIANVKAVIQGNNGVNYIQEYRGIAVDNPNDFYFRFTVDNCHLEFNDVIGALDNSTNWWGDHSVNFEVPVGQTVTTRIRNYTSGQNNWNNFAIVLTSDGTNEYAVVRADNYGWGAGYDGNPNLQTSGGQSDWDAWLAAMDGALCTISVTNNDGSVDVKIVMEGNDGNTYYQDYKGISPTYGNDVFFRFTVDGSHLIAGITGGVAEIQKKRTIHVATAGTLSQLISENEKYQIEELTLTGYINGTDLGFLREMAGKATSYRDDSYAGSHLFDWGVISNTEGKLKVLDLSGVNITSGGAYLTIFEEYDISTTKYYYVQSNEIPEGVFGGGSGLTSILIPNTVTSIGDKAFYDCGGLTSITIPNSVTFIASNAFSGTAWYDNQPDGLVYAGKVAYKYKGEMPEKTNITIKDGTYGVTGYAFLDCKNLASVTIPNSVSTIGGHAFDLCSGLTSITIPSSVIAIGDYAFSGCSGLTTITSGIEKPFEIYSFTFDSDTYNVAELIVPKGTKALYQATKGWNKFTKITEVGEKDEVTFTIDGISYQGSKSAKVVVVKSVDVKLKSAEIPASVSHDGTTYQVTGVADDAFKGCSMGALVWDVEAALPNNAFSNASIGSNFLLYVKSSSYAPSTVKNVVVDGTAQTIVLSDNGGQFYCPQMFIARSISYTHSYTMETGGSGKGWESLALPFFVQKISHSTRGEIVPFALYSSSSSQKPFWLGKFSGSEFKWTSAIEANEPYIIAMPNSKNYRNEYNLAGEVTFSAENAAVPKTPAFDGTFVPAFTPVAKSSSVKALNNASYSGGYDPGSRFIPNLRDVHPFEAYMTGSSSRGIIEISFDNGTTSLNEELRMKNEESAGATEGEIVIHTLSGQEVTRTTQRDFDAVWQQLPKGVYVVNGKKMIK